MRAQPDGHLESAPSMRIVAVFAVLLATMLAGPAPAQTNALQQLAAKPAKETKSSSLQAAQQGDPEAQVRLGLAYLRGKGIKGIARNPAEAVTWLSLAAAWGRVDAALELAQAYDKGRGLKKDRVQAARWWFRAGKLGDEPARERFLQMFLAGDTDDIGGIQAVDWLTVRAISGDAKAILGLATVYERGQGVVIPDPAEAERWYVKLALAGDAEARFRLGRMKLAQPSLWRAPETEVKDGKWTGAAWTATRPETDTHAYLGRPGMLAAERWLTAAGRQGHAEALFLLATAKLNGTELPFNLTEGVTYLEAAAEKGHAGALMAIARLANKGQGYHGKDPVRAWVSYDLAAQAGRKAAENPRDLLAKTMSARQLSRARQLSQDIRDMRGM